ncbi:MAG: DNA polymerase [Minisyncoccia bacterium]|jgi:DNA polymerase-1
MEEKLLLIDINSLLHRLYHAIPLLRSSQGLPTNALYGLTNVLLKILDEIKTDYIVACYDTPVLTVRHEKFKEYKAQRPKIADDLKTQISYSKKLLQAFNIQIAEKPGYEADDLIGTLAEKNKDKKVIILSGDLDTLQLVNDRVNIYFLKKGIKEIEVYDRQKVLERFNIEPYLLPDFKALVGDPSDNIIGIKGIGEKTAINLIKKYGNIEKIIEAAEKGFLEYSLRKAILENKDRLILNKDLTTIIKDVEIELQLKKYQKPSKEQLLPILEELGFKSIIARLFKDQKVSLFTTTSQYKSELPSDLKEIFVILYQDKIYASFNNEIVKLDVTIDNLQKIINTEKIYIFDLKQFFKKFYEVMNTQLPLNKFFDLKIAFWLVTPYNKITLEKLTNIYSSKPLLTLKDCLDFILLNYKSIANELESKIKEFNLEEILHLDQQVSQILGLMELNGILLDREKLKSFKEFLIEEINRLKKEIYELAGTPFNVNSPIELRYILFTKLKLPTKGLKKTPKGEISTQESELIKLKDQHPIIEKILEYREKMKISTTFSENLLKFIKADGRITTNFEITGTATGRISSEEPNLQNLPVEGELARKLRACFVAPNGFKYVSFDYSQIELRIAAELSQDENLITIFKQDLDIHSITAKLLFKEENEKTRRLAKIINFGIIYGISPKGLKERTGLSLTESKKLIDSYFKNFSGVQKMVKELIEKAKTYGYAENIFGRKRFIPELYSRAYSEVMKGERIAINTPIQGTAADIMKKAMVQIYEFIKNNNLENKAKIILQIHDELILEVSDDIINLIKEEVKKIMENVVQFSIPLKVKVSIGKDLAEIKR